VRLLRLSLCLIVAAWVARTAIVSAATDQPAGSNKPVLAVPSQRLVVSASGDQGFLPLYVSIRGMNADLGRVYPAVTRAVIIIHGNRRDAGRYDNIMQNAIHNAGEKYWNTLLIAPEFLEENDAATNQVPDDELRWRHLAWIDGENARNLQISSYDALDAILERLSNHLLLPNLESVVLVGYAGGAMMVQRYAVAGRGGDALEHAGIRLRYIVANPSSYLYFSGERPVPGSMGDYDFAVPARECSGDNNRWRYGVKDPPPYAADDDFAALEQRYIHRDVVYLLGAEALDPNEASFDLSCAAEDQGPTRYGRGSAYFRYLELRHPELATEPASQKLLVVQGVGNDAYKLMTSTCGKASLFFTDSCPSRILVPKP
jgi:pimeloyl-ACP methyl ester carboxylesterase